MGHHPDRLPREVMAWDGDLPLLSCVCNLPLRISGNLEAMVALLGRAALIDNLPNAADRIATILLEVQAALQG